MNRILIAAVAVLGMAGVASAQQAPQLHGNYSADVLNAYNHTTLPGTSRDTGNVDLSSYASITNVFGAKGAKAQSPLSTIEYSR